MRQGNLWIVAGGLAVHERGRSERRSTDQVSADKRSASGAGDLVSGANLHQQVVRMLIVDEGGLPVALAGLEQLRRTLAANRERLQREHRLEPHLSAPERMIGAAHDPVLRLPAREVGELPILVVVAHKHVGIPGPCPAALAGRGHLVMMWWGWRLLCERGRRGRGRDQPGQSRERLTQARATQAGLAVQSGCRWLPGDRRAVHRDTLSLLERRR